MNTQYSQLRAMFSITKASLISMFRSTSTVVFSLVFPLVFIVIFGFLGGDGITIDLAVVEGTVQESPIYEALKKNDSINLITNTTADTIDSDLKSGRIDGSIRIKKAEDGSLPLYAIELTTTNASPETGSILRSIIEGMSDKMNIAFSDIKTPAITLTTEEVKGREFKTIDFILPGQLGFSLLNIGVFGTAFVLINLRETLVLKRFFATPIRKANILLGEGLSRLIFAVIQGSIIVLIGALFLGYTLVHGFPTLINIMVMILLGVIVFMGFGFIISAIAKDENAVPSLANLVTLPQFLLSGTFFTIDAFPSWLQPISKVMPLTYLNEAIRKIAFEGVPLTEVTQQILILTLWGIVLYFLAIKLFKWK